jgi:hypothetical protein
MKKIILSVAILLSATYSMAQDETVVNLYVQTRKYDEAKGQVDKWLSNPKLKPKDKQTALLYKFLVYGDIYGDSALSVKYPDANIQALDAFNQYQALDPTLKQLKDQKDIFASGFQSIDNGYLNRGNNFWTNKNYDSAFKYFSQALSVRQTIYSNNLTQSTPTFDTLLTVFTAYAAQNAKLVDSAARYYSELADLKIGGTDYEDIYKFLLQYYSDKKDDANFKKYLATAKELYPNDSSLWTQYEMNAITSNTSLTDLLQKYQQDAAAGGMNEDKLVGYAEAFATNDKTQLASLDSMQKIALKLAAADAFAKAFALNDTMGLYAFNTGVIYYGIYSDLDDRYHANAGESAALKTKRAEIAKQEMAYADTASQWLEKTYPVLKGKTDRTKAETSSLNRAVGYLANIYLWQRDQTKVNGNSKDYDKYDALYKKYDAEYNTYK